jgi:eukaryotic-like serine/threonine-protein kinase
VFWSPDSRSIFYSVKRVLRQVSVETGATRDVATLPWMVMDGTWRGDGRKDGSEGEDLLYVWAGPADAYEVSAKTGAARAIAVKGFRWAQFLPDGRHFLHVDFDPAIERYRAVLTDYTTGASTALLESDSRVEYAPPRREHEPGHLLFVRGGSLLAQAFDTERLRLIGEPQQLAQNIVYFKPSASACFSVSENGVLVYQSGFPVSELRWYDRTGKVISSTKEAAFSGTVRVSPDGQRAAADVWTPASGVRDVWVFGEDGASRRLTYPNPPTVHVRPVWSPDGTRIAFGMSHTSAPRLAAVSTDESAKEALLVNGDAGRQPDGALQIPTDWSRDGRYIAYDTSLGEEEREVWLLDVKAGKIWPLLKSGASHWGAAFSPDGRKIAFVSDESGRPEVYEQDFAAEPTPHVVGEKRQVSRGGGWLVRWRPDGHELFYLGVDARMYAVPLEHGVASGDAQALFQVPGEPQYGTPTDVQFDVAPGGQRFVITTAGSAAPPEFVVVQNWQQVLGR